VQRWHLVSNCLNTHQSESLVHPVAKWEGLDIDLGVKGKRGILQSMQSRAAFLSAPTHRIMFHCSPSHLITAAIFQFPGQSICRITTTIGNTIIDSARDPAIQPFLQGTIRSPLPSLSAFYSPSDSHPSHHPVANLSCKYLQIDKSNHRMNRAIASAPKRHFSVTRRNV
jgi:hypothetical protein